MAKPRPRLGESLLESGVLTKETLEKALQIQKKRQLRLGTILLQEGFVSEPQLLQALSRTLSIPWVSLWRIDIPDSVLDLVPTNIAEEFFLIPIYIRTEKSGDRALYVAMNDPSDEDALRFVAASAGMVVKPMIAGPSDIAAAIRYYYYGEEYQSTPPQNPVDGTRSSIPPLAPAQEKDNRAPLPPISPKQQLVPNETEDDAEDLTDELIEVEIAENQVSPKDDPTQKTAPPIHVEDKAIEDSASVNEAPTADTLRDSVAPVERSPSSPPRSADPSSEQPLPESSVFTDKTAAQREAERRIFGVGKQKSPGGFSLTLLDGTTLSFGGEKKAKSALDGRITKQDLIEGLKAAAKGTPIDDFLPADKWQSYMAAMLKLLLDKHLIFFEEFIDELEKTEK